MCLTILLNLRNYTISFSIDTNCTDETVYQDIVVYTFAYVTHSVYFGNIWVFFILDTSVNNFM